MNALRPSQNGVADTAQGEPKALALYLEGWSQLYERRQRGIGPRVLEEVIGHAADAGTHDLPLSEISDAVCGMSPTADNRSACKNESPEAASGRNHAGK